MPDMFSLRLVLLLVASSCLAAQSAPAVETVVFSEPGKTASRTVIGEVLVEAQDGGLLLRGDDGRIWRIQPEQISKRDSDDTELIPINADVMQQRMLDEMPGDFKVYRTANYLIVYNSNEGHARAVGALFEQLYKGFFTYWKNQKWKLSKPRFPLVALVLKDRQDFLQYGQADVGDTAKSVIGYYNLASNRMTTFNMPNYERNVATIVHEATHQLAYNCNMQKRFADNPMWVSEGLAMFFESPDMSNPRGWRGIGRVNQVNLRRWHKYLPHRPAESLATLLADDTRFRNASTAEAAYAEGWAMTYFLIKTRRREYTQYLQLLSEGKPYSEKSARERIQMFEQAFDTTLVKMDKAFLTYMRRVR